MRQDQHRRIYRPSMERQIEHDEPVVEEEPPKKKQPRKQRIKKEVRAEPVRKKLPDSMKEKLRAEHAEGATVEQLVRRWGLLEEEVNDALG